MIKIMSLLFVVIAPTLTGIAVVAVLAMSSPIDGGTPLSQQGSVILMVVIGAALASLPISYMVAKMVARLTAANEPGLTTPAQAPTAPQKQTQAEAFAQAQRDALPKAQALAENN
ncbi:MAG: hypothetical protein L3J67_11530 [Hyphomicrobiaceae bacterium]|nr:hypothetical protein [Hyphomicrobiaceae bacterium]